MLCQPCNSDDRLQIVIEGTVNIYHIRDEPDCFQDAEDGAGKDIGIPG